MSYPLTKIRFLNLVSHFGRNRAGNIAVTFAIAALPILAAIGCAVDYSLYVRMKSKMQAAADSASVGAISQSSPGYAAASLMTANGPVVAGATDATNIFNANLKGVLGYSNLTVTPTVQKNNLTITSTVAFSANISTSFLGIIGYPTMTMQSTSASSASLSKYLDFYLMLDVSGSMGLASTDAEAVRLSAVNPDMYSSYPTGCTLGCHFGTQNDACPNWAQKYSTNNYCLGYSISRVSQSALQTTLSQNSNHLPNSWISTLPNSLTSNLPSVASCPTDGTDSCIQLRADAVGYAVNQLFSTANATMKVPNQFRIGLYPFVQYLYAYYALTSNINGSVSNSTTINYAAANLASQLDTNQNSNLGSGGTHFENAFPAINNMITSVGTGSSWNNTLPYVFLITDGAQDPQTKALNGGGWSGSNQATVLDPVAQCKPLKDRGIIISVLYVPYKAITPPNPSFAGNEDGAANNNIQYIPASLQACASPNFFFTANTPADIAAALNKMFNQALVTAHVTQ